MERARFESKIRRLKLSCAQWKGNYQKEIQKRYRDMVSVLESRYMRWGILYCWVVVWDRNS